MALWAFNRLGEAQDRVNQHSVPGMAAAFGIARQGGALVAAAPRLTAATSREEFATVAADLDGERAVFESRLSDLMQHGEQPIGVRARAEALTGSAGVLSEFGQPASVPGRAAATRLARGC